MNREHLTRVISRELPLTIRLLALRGADSCASAESDLDFISSQGSSLLASIFIGEIVSNTGGFVILRRDLRYMHQIVAVWPGNLASDFRIKIDIFNGLAWAGLLPDCAGEKLWAVIEAGELSLELAAGIVGIVQKLCYGGRLGSKDCARAYSLGVTHENLKYWMGRLGILIPPDALREGDITFLQKLRARASTAGISGVRLIPWLSIACFETIRLRLKYMRSGGVLIGLSGLDGSGKSTLVNRLIEAFEACNGEKVLQVHLLPAWIRLPHQLIRRRTTESNYQRPYSEKPVKSLTSALARLTYYSAAFAMGKLWLMKQVAAGKVVVMDRSFVDFAADPRRSRIPFGRLPTWLSTWLRPKGHLIFLDASPATVLQRKGELTLDKATTLRAAYLRVSDQLSVGLVNADKSQDSVFYDVVETISKRSK